MKLIAIVASAFLFSLASSGANLNVDATKKKEARIIQPFKQKAKIATGIQGKRFKTAALKTKTAPLGDKRYSTDVEGAGESMNRYNDQSATLVSERSKRAIGILDKTVTASQEFEKAYRDALTVELSKRAAAQVEIKKKKKVSQRDINKDAKVRRSDRDGFEVQQAGSEAH